MKPIIANRSAVAFAESGYSTNVIVTQYPYKLSKQLNASELKDMNALKLYGGNLHWSWVPTLNDKEMMKWLYSQK